MSLILPSSCWFSVMYPPDASACRTAICSSSLFPVPKAPPLRLSQFELFSLSFTQSVSAILSLYVSILACPVKVLSIIVPARFRDVSYVVFVAFPCDASNAYPGLRELQHPKTKRRIFCAQPPEIFRPQFLAIEVPFLLRQR